MAAEPATRLLGPVAIIPNGIDLAAYQAPTARAFPGVRFLGRVDEAAKREALAQASVLCAPNTGSESFGIVPLEEMAAGCAVIAADLPAFRSVLGEAGMFTPVGTPTGSPLASSSCSEFLSEPPPSPSAASAALSGSTGPPSLVSTSISMNRHADQATTSAQARLGPSSTDADSAPARLLCVSGPPASGKTRLARTLAATYRLPLLSRDDATAIGRVCPPHQGTAQAQATPAPRLWE